MKALVYHGNRDVRYQDVADPTPGDGDALIRIDYCGICATDLEEYQFGPNFIFDEPNPVTGKMLPLVIGHELTGTVVALGRSASGVAVGDRVVVDGVLTCGQCWWCRSGRANLCPGSATVGFAADGGLAEYVAWPASQAVALPDNVSSEEAGLNEPTAVAHHAVRQGKIGAGDRVAVLGAGVVGLLAMQAARAKGAWVCAIDVRPMSLERAAELGADATLDSSEGDVVERLADMTEGRGADVVIDAAGAPRTPHLAIELARSRRTGRDRRDLHRDARVRLQYHPVQGGRGGRVDRLPAAGRRGRGPHARGRHRQDGVAGLRASSAWTRSSTSATRG